MALITAYVNLYHLVPRYLVRELYGDYFLRLILLLAIYCAVYTGWYIFFLEFFFKITDHQSYIRAYVSNIFELAFMLQMTTAFKLGKDWFRQQQVNRELVTEKLISEVRFLRAQINPHFLFNTLNNLYALTLKKSDNAPGAILRLSGIMEYMMYDSNEPLVSLEKEIDYLKSYIEMEKLRHADSARISFKIPENTASYQLPPLLLLAFVENAFKHSAPGNQLYISIRIYIENDTLFFIAENSMRKTPGDKDTRPGGVGLINVRKRLSLLYPGKHSLDISERNGMYIVNLSIKIA